MNIFLNRFYKNNIPLINNKSIYTNLKESYFGGITEVYKPYGKNLYYYDVNSLYPHSALNPMPGLNCVYEEDINKNIKDIINNMFGFYYCRIKTSDKYLGLLPFRDKQGIIMPTGEWEGLYFSEELKFAYDNGYEIQVMSGYHFDKNDNVFSDYVNFLYNIKSTTKDSVIKSIAKSLLNNLLGKFGLDINKYESSILSEERLGDIIEARRFRGIKEISKDKYLVSYDVEVSKDICEQHGLDYKKEFVKSLKIKDIKVFKETNFTDVSVAISSAVTSYSRIFMNKVKLDVLSKGGSIFYTDTDSIVTDIKLDASIVGEELGKFKLEHEVEEGYFISNKTYALKKKGGKVIIKNKGSDTKSLTFENFKELYLGINVKAIRYESKRDYFNRSVTINIPNDIVLSVQSYRKRVKIFNANNV
jgi:DNA polymerase type B, organellar and viral